MAVRHRAINSSNADYLPIIPQECILMKSYWSAQDFIRENAFGMPSAKCRPFCSGVKE